MGMGHGYSNTLIRISRQVACHVASQNIDNSQSHTETYILKTNLRVRQWLKLDELLEKERNEKESCSRRAGMVANLNLK